jgi:hypothetical protein
MVDISNDQPRTTCRLHIESVVITSTRYEFLFPERGTHISTDKSYTYLLHSIDNIVLVILIDWTLQRSFVCRCWQTLHLFNHQITLDKLDFAIGLMFSELWSTIDNVVSFFALTHTHTHLALLSADMRWMCWQLSGL